MLAVPVLEAAWQVGGGGCLHMVLDWGSGSIRNKEAVVAAQMMPNSSGEPLHTPFILAGVRHMSLLHRQMPDLVFSLLP